MAQQGDGNPSSMPCKRSQSWYTDAARESQGWPILKGPSFLPGSYFPSPAPLPKHSAVGERRRGAAAHCESLNWRKSNISWNKTTEGTLSSRLHISQVHLSSSMFFWQSERALKGIIQVHLWWTQDFQSKRRGSGKHLAFQSPVAYWRQTTADPCTESKSHCCHYREHHTAATMHHFWELH